jgi:chromosome segregation ATPase
LRRADERVEKFKADAE